MLITCRGDINAYGKGEIHYTDRRVLQFVEASLVGKQSLTHLALRLDAYCTSGWKGKYPNLFSNGEN